MRRMSPELLRRRKRLRGTPGLNFSSLGWGKPYYGPCPVLPKPLIPGDANHPSTTSSPTSPTRSHSRKLSVSCRSRIPPATAHVAETSQTYERLESQIRPTTSGKYGSKIQRTQSTAALACTASVTRPLFFWSARLEFAAFNAGRANANCEALSGPLAVSR